MFYGKMQVLALSTSAPARRIRARKLCS